MSTKGIAHHQWRYGQRQAAVPISAHEETRHLREQDAAFIQHLRKAYQEGQFPQ